MLAPQLLGRLLTEVKNNNNVRTLLRQCDEDGPIQNALLPTYHCMHTPGGPLKYVGISFLIVHRGSFNSHSVMRLFLNQVN